MRTRNRVQLICADPSRAIQSQAAEADINTIVRNFGVTGRLPQSTRLPTYGDFEGVDDYRTAVEAVKAAEAAFLAVPARIRSQFDNDPQAFMDFCEDSRNLGQLRDWGLAPTPSPDPAPESKTGG